jgi:hypothetical protein
VTVYVIYGNNSVMRVSIISQGFMKMKYKIGMEDIGEEKLYS